MRISDWSSDVCSSDLFRWRKIYDKVGILNQNCVVQVDGLHYVFDKDDIYLHDGASKKSIIHGKDKDFVFQSLNYSKAWLAFVSHDPRLNAIQFRSEEHTSELQSLMRQSYAVFCLKK